MICVQYSKNDSSYGVRDTIRIRFTFDFIQVKINKYLYSHINYAFELGTSYTPSSR